MTFVRTRLALALATALVAATGAGATTASTESSARRLVVLYWNDVAVRTKTAALERQLGFESELTFALRGFRGFKASLTEAQVDELRKDDDVLAVRADPAVYVLAFARGVEVDERTSRLERLVGFRSDFRYRRLIRGFAARLSVRDVLTAAVDTAFDPVGGEYLETFVAADGTGFVVLYRSDVDAVAKTDALQQTLGLRLRFRYDALAGFAADLFAAQLHALTEDEDVSHILYNTRFCAIPEGCRRPQDLRPPAAVRLAATKATRRALRAQLVRADLSLRRAVLRRVHVARSFGTVDYAAATLSVAGKTRTDLFRRHVAGRWLWVGRSPSFVCLQRGEPAIPPEIVRAWGIRLRSGCFRFPSG